MAQFFTRYMKPDRNGYEYSQVCVYVQKIIEHSYKAIEAAAGRHIEKPTKEDVQALRKEIEVIKTLKKVSTEKFEKEFLEKITGRRLEANLANDTAYTEMFGTPYNIDEKCAFMDSEDFDFSVMDNYEVSGEHQLRFFKLLDTNYENLKDEEIKEIFELFPNVIATFGDLGELYFEKEQK